MNIYGNGTTTASNGANTITHYYDRAGIEAANATAVYGQFIDRKSMPLRSGKTYKISKWQHLYDLDETDAGFAAKGYLGKRDLDSISAKLHATDGTGAKLTEGAGPINEVTPKKITVETEIATYGFMINYTDEVAMFSEDDVQVKYREELGYLMNQTYEDLVQRDMLEGAGVIVNAGGDIDEDEIGKDIGTHDENAEKYKVSFDLIRKGVKILVRNRAKRNTQIVTGSTKIGTKPINKAFYAIIGPEVKYDLESITRGSGSAEEFAYVPAYKYAGATNLAEGEIGSMHDVRFIESEGAMQHSSAGAEVPDGYDGVLSYTGDNTGDDGDRGHFDTFPILFPTQGAVAALGIKGKGKVQFFSKAPGELELNNPYATKGFFSAKMHYASVILEPKKLLRINVVATK